MEDEKHLQSNAFRWTSVKVQLKSFLLPLSQVELPSYLEVEGGRQLQTFDDFRRLLNVARKVPDIIDQIIDLVSML